jgi:hypothetical protein
MSDNPYRVPKDIPGKTNLKDYMNDGWIVFTILFMGISFIGGLIIGVLADGFRL